MQAESYRGVDLDGSDSRTLLLNICDILVEVIEEIHILDVVATQLVTKHALYLTRFAHRKCPFVPVFRLPATPTYAASPLHMPCVVCADSHRDKAIADLPCGEGLVRLAIKRGDGEDVIARIVDGSDIVEGVFIRTLSHGVVEDIVEIEEDDNFSPFFFFFF